MIARITRIAMLLALAVVLLFLCGAFYLSSTSSGAQWLINQAVSIANENLSVERVAGSLLDGLKLENIDYSNPAAHTRVENLAISLDWKALISRTLSVRSLVVDGITIIASDSEDTAAREPFDSSSMKLPTLPIDVRVNAVKLTDITIKQGDAETYVTSASAELLWHDETLSVNNFDIAMAEQSLSTNIVLISAPREPLAITLSSEFNGVANGENIHGSLSLLGPLNEIAVEVALTSPVETKLAGTVRLDGTDISFTFQGAHDSLASVTAASPVTFQHGTVDIDGDLNTVKLNYSGRAHHPSGGDINIQFDSALALPAEDDPAFTATGQFKWDIAGNDALSLPPLSGEGAYHASPERLQITHGTAPPYRITSEILISDLTTSPRITGSNTWLAFGPIGLGGKKLSSERGSITIDGLLSALDIVAALVVQVDELPALDIQASAHATDKDVQLSKFRIATLDGEINGTGQAQWVPDTRSQFELRASALNLAPLGFYNATKLDFVANGALSLVNEVLSGDITLNAVRGTWLDQTLKGNAALSIAGKNIELKRSEFAIGRNRVNARGKFGETIDGDFELDIANFDEIDPRFEGKLSGTGHVSGRIDAPKVELALSGVALKFAQFSSDEFSLSVVGDLANANSPLAADIKLKRIKIDDFFASELALNVEGSTEAHSISVSLYDPQLSASLDGEGSLSATHWQGVISDLELKLAPIGKWQLEQGIDVKVEKAGFATVSPGCLIRIQSRICVEANRFGAPDGTINLDIRALPLAMLASRLPTDSKLSGALHAHINATGSGDTLNANGTLNVAGGVISIDVGSEEQRDFKAETFSADFVSTALASKIDVAVAITDFLSLTALGSVAHAPDGVIDVDAKLNIPNLLWLENFAPELAGSNGAFNGDITIAGTVASPVARAEFALNNGAIRYAEVGLVIDEIRLNLQTLGDDPNERNIRFDGLLGSPEGDITLNGTVLATSDGAPSFALQITGEEFALARLPNVEIDISPKLTLQGDPNLIQVSGDLIVPKFNYTVTQLPKGTVSVSSDQIILDPNGDPVAEPNAGQSALMQHLGADVKIKLGENVSIAGLGVQTNLIGELRIRRDPAIHTSIPAIANGTISMIGGSFDAYGQKLSITKGNFLFAGPIDNPNINVRAERDDIAVTAGIHAIGSAKNPKISLFSNPSLSDAETLAYIMTGSGLNDASKSEAQLVTEAAFAFGLEQASVITDGVRDLFGLDSFGVGGADSENVSLTAGKRLTPKLSLRSQLDVFDQLWSFFLRYDLAKNWGIEAESGRRQGGDLLYSIEREYLFSPD